MAPRWLRALPLLVLGTSLTAMAPAQALVPYTYVPQRQELEGAGLGIAQPLPACCSWAKPAMPLAWPPSRCNSCRPIPAPGFCWQRPSCAAGSSRRPPCRWPEPSNLTRPNAGIWFAEASLALRDKRPSRGDRSAQRGPEAGLPQRQAPTSTWAMPTSCSTNPRQALAAFERAASAQGLLGSDQQPGAGALRTGPDVDRAIERWRRVLQIKPDAAEPNLALAAALFQRGGCRPRGSPQTGQPGARQ
jgi:hypothetical protein